MRVGLLALLWLIFPVGRAAAAPCDLDLQKRVSVCEPPKEERERLMKMVRRVVEAHGIYQDSWSREITLREMAAGKEDLNLLGKWRRSLIDVEWQRKRMELYAGRALLAVQRIYGIVPTAISREVFNGPFARHPARWEPRFLHSRKIGEGEYQAAYRSEKCPDGSEYFLETRFGSGDGGVTDEDGQVNIGIEAFYWSVRYGSPLLLALTVHHEEVHFWELVSSGWDTHEDGEKRVWGKTLAAAEAMGADALMKNDIEQQMLNFEKDAEGGGDGVAASSSPFHSENIQFDAAFDFEKALLDSQMANLERGALSRRLEDLRAEAAGKSEAAKKAGMLTRLEEEAARCGFKLLHPGNWDRYGFYEEEVPGNRHLGAHYYFARGLNWDEFRTVLFLARVCLDEGLGEPCNDGLDIINLRWGKDGFGDGWELAVEGGQGGQEACLEYLQGRLKPPMSVRGIDTAASRAWKDLRKRWKREGEAAMRRHRQQQAEAERPRKIRDRDTDDSDDERRCGNANSETGIVGCRSR